jgi:crotonobetainyl-CoA:carnitine CoA-transferase CaiB-like acyl-CoA transferase
MRSAFGSLGIGKDFPNPAFAQDNRGKRSIILDLRQPEAKEHLEELLSTADVFLTNLRPDALDGLGLEPAATVARHPRLVYSSVSGYGLRGEDRNRPAYDIGAFWARSGLSVQLANSEGVPLNARGGIGDHISGLAALAGLLAAVLEQRQTGRGRVVEVSLLRTGTYVLGWDLSLQETVGKVAKAEARDSNQTPLMNSYRTRDGRWFFFTGLEADRHIDAVLRALGRPELRADPRFADARALRKNRTEVIAVLDDIVGERTLSEWAERLDAEGVWWALAQGPADVLEDRQLAANDGFLALPADPDGKIRRSINGPVSFSDLPVGQSPPAPFLGEHTDEVLAELAARRGAGEEPA